MNQQEQVQAQQEARAVAAHASRSTERARLWAGMNRYLAVEAEHAHHVSSDADDAEPVPTPSE